MSSKCEDCKFSFPTSSYMTAQEWLDRAEALRIHCENIEKEMDKGKKGIGGWIPSYSSTSILIEARSRMFDAKAQAKRLDDMVECRRYPKSIEVRETYCCGEFERKCV